jgi:hypothetical protein
MSILHKIKRKRDEWIGHILCKTWFSRHVTERKNRREGRMRKKM